MAIEGLLFSPGCFCRVVPDRVPGIEFRAESDTTAAAVHSHAVERNYRGIGHRYGHQRTLWHQLRQHVRGKFPQRFLGYSHRLAFGRLRFYRMERSMQRRQHL